MIVVDATQTAINLKALRKQHNLSTYQLANLLGISRPPIYRWENGRHVPTVDHLILLSELYEVPIDAIVARKEV